MIHDRSPNAFSAGVAGWLDSLGQLRDVVRQEVLAAQLSELAGMSGAPLRVLDIGCGQGTQAMRLARDGHEVTGLDPSQELLDHFGRDLDSEAEAVRGRVHPPGPRCRRGRARPGRQRLRPGPVPRSAHVPRRPHPDAGRGDRLGGRRRAGLAPGTQRPRPSDARRSAW
ncbi:MAG: hypothetical protein DLM58_07305 [Pseudonocardiales bacterium]|nr:MAG: hypothetical protein DLM58_07305 [Pseudonocardiales bacterium]